MSFSKFFYIHLKGLKFAEFRVSSKPDIISYQIQQITKEVYEKNSTRISEACPAVLKGMLKSHCRDNLNYLPGCWKGAWIFPLQKVKTSGNDVWL